MTNERNQDQRRGLPPGPQDIRPGGDVRPLRARLGGSLRADTPAQLNPADTRPIIPTQAHHRVEAATLQPQLPSSAALAPASPVRPKQRNRRKKRGSPLARGLGYIALALLCIILAAGTFLFIADPADLIRDQLIARVKSATGRDLIIAGGTRFTVFPSIGVSMSDVSLSPPPGMKGKPTLTMARLNTSLKLMPLLQRQMVVERLILTKPFINLHVDFRGRKSWDFAAAKSLPLTGRIRYAQNRPKGQINDAAPNGALPPALQEFANGSIDAAAARSPLAMLEGLSLEDVRIVGGKLQYSDERSGERHNLDAINLKVSLADIVSPLRAKGDLVWTGEKIDLSAELKSLKALLGEQKTKLATTISMRHVNASYNGTIAVAGPIIDLDGKVTAKSRSLRQLAGWLGTTVPPSSGFGAADLSGWLNLRGNRIEMIRTKLSMDGATANGDIKITTGGRKPKIRARLNLSLLDLNKYISGDTLDKSPARSSNVRARKPAQGASGAKNINDLLGRPAKGSPQVRGFTKRANTGWSTQLIDASALNLVDAQIKFNVGRILYKDIKIGDSRLNAKLKNGKLVANLLDMKLYQGIGAASMTISPRRSGIRVNANVRLTNISALPLLRDAAKFERVDGRGNLNLLVSSEGVNQKAIINSLLGNGRFSFKDGAIVGLNIPKLIRGLQSGRIGNLNGGKAERTDFSELSGTFQINNGVAKNTDLRLVSPLLRLGGAGIISLGPRTLDYTVKPKIVASLSGQGSTSPLSGLEIPVRIIGSWDKPQIKADLAALTANPEKTLKTIERIGKSLKGKNGKQILNDLLGGKGGKSKAKDLLNQLFR